MKPLDKPTDYFKCVKILFKHIFLINLLSSTFGLTLAQTPIPSRPDGYTYHGVPGAHVVLDVFVDLMCPDSRTVYPVMKQVAENYAPEDLQLRFHVFPLPYHRNAYIMAQGTLTIDEAEGIDGVFQYFDAIYSGNTQDLFTNKPTANMTTMEVQDAIGRMAVAAVDGLTMDEWRAGQANSNDDWGARVSWKYACSKSVTGTPWWFINDVYVAGQYTWTAENWESIIDSVLGSAKQASLLTTGECPTGQVSCEYLPGSFQCCLAGEYCIPNVGCRC